MLEFSYSNKFLIAGDQTGWIYLITTKEKIIIKE